jgi:DDE superfamily endonuclease/Winged helix-turn helix
MSTKPLYVRALTDAERQALEAALRSYDAFALRRAQILLASARKERVGAIAAAVGCSGQTVRQVIHTFHREGLAALQRQSTRNHTLYYCFDTAAAQGLRHLLHQSPRRFGKPTSVWTLELAAEVAYAQGLTAWRVSDETIRATLARMGVRWRRAKHWITSPDPAYARKKARRDRLIRLAQAHPDWLLGFEDEVWWSRLARPALHAWQDAAHPLRLVEQAVAPDDLDPKALACYGLLARSWDARQHRTEAMWLRFVDGRPVSAVTIDFLRWCAEQAQGLGKRAVLLVWDNAPWHESQSVRAWLRTHNRQVKRTGQGVRLIACFLPVKSPWLNPIEPKWLVGTRRVAEPERLLTALEVVERVCTAYGCPHHPHLLAPPPAKRKQAASKKAA